MPLRIDTTLASGEGDPWTPAADFTVQAAGVAGTNATVELQARLDASAPWVSISSMKPASQSMMACRKLFSVRLVWTSNKPGDALKVWSAE
ncbi:hypothetical protein [Rhizobium sp. Leaf341]|uniref:hypothetical protein n=1 Tax=Rhizobium sp. Leaf341 TaxID=1736344 RepID=UPI000713E4B4|nr:hypothetical protein [Rhizobium sp. Leaf341]KQR75737.1 hypothetical protein ASG03_18880 [Rhizobium sp. Leaf341]